MAKIVARFKIVNPNERFNISSVINSKRLIVTDSFTQNQWMIETTGVAETAKMCSLNDTEWMAWLDGVNAFHMPFSE